MGEHPDQRASKRERPSGRADATTDESIATPKQLQAIAHSRGRICKVRDCKVCAPLREQRRLKKAQRKADAQAQQHAKGEPCGRSHCPVQACVEARHADPGDTAPDSPRADERRVDPDAAQRRQAERHRAGLPCGSEDCPSQVCVEGFAKDRARRHRAGRPCRSTECANPVCVAARSSR